VKIFSVALGILAAIGGFVDIGDIVFNVAAGAMFGYDLLWVVVVGVGGIIVYSEMCGGPRSAWPEPNRVRGQENGRCGRRCTV
jgi:hypothetical protein